MKEFADFLAGQPPFDALDPDDLARVVARLDVEYFAAGATVVPEGEPMTHLWVVRTGALEVVDRGRVVDLLEPGDTYGHVWLLSGLPPPVRVRAHEESLCLRIADPRTFLARPELLRYAAVRSSSGGHLSIGGSSRADQPLARLARPVVWCDAGDRVRDVAERIGAAGLSCALVRVGPDLGIVTDADFRREVAAGRVGVDDPVSALATVPVLTVEEDATQAAGLLRMVEHGVHHLIVVGEDGDPTGVVRAVDLAQADVRDPLLVRSAIDDAADLDELAEAYRLLPTTLVELSDNGVAASHIGAIHATVVDAVVRRVLRLRHSPALDAVRHSWVLLGSLARREPLPMSDVDTALVWADPPADRGDQAGESADAIRAAAWDVLDGLRHCGLELCANGANAHNPLFSRSRSEWIEAAWGWQRDPTQENALLLSAMVADSRPLTDPELGRALTDGIRSHTRSSQFLRAVLDEALGWRPPTGFVRDFVVQHTGEHRGQVDLKAGGLAPIVSLARWIAIAAGDATGTTGERLRRGAALGLLTADETDTLVGGWESVYGLLLHRQVEAIRAGETPSTYLAPKELDTLARRHLRETFRAIALVQARVDRAWLHRLER